jgi:hypothetical protein
MSSAPTDLVFDTSAIVALFQGEPGPVRWWRLADDELSGVKIAFPVGAMLDAARESGIRSSAWDGPLWPPQVRVLPLDETAAKEIGDQPGQLGVRHVQWEAAQLGWPILTSTPGAYPDGNPLLAF